MEGAIVLIVGKHMDTAVSKRTAGAAGTDGDVSRRLGGGASCGAASPRAAAVAGAALGCADGGACGWCMLLSF